MFATGVLVGVGGTVDVADALVGVGGAMVGVGAPVGAAVALGAGPAGMLTLVGAAVAVGVTDSTGGDVGTGVGVGDCGPVPLFGSAGSGAYESATDDESATPLAGMLKSRIGRDALFDAVLIAGVGLVPVAVGATRVDLALFVEVGVIGAVAVGARVLVGRGVGVGLSRARP